MYPFILSGYNIEKYSFCYCHVMRVRVHEYRIAGTLRNKSINHNISGVEVGTGIPQDHRQNGIPVPNYRASNVLQLLSYSNGCCYKCHFGHKSYIHGSLHWNITWHCQSNIYWKMDLITLYQLSVKGRILTSNCYDHFHSLIFHVHVFYACTPCHSDIHVYFSKISHW